MNHLFQTQTSLGHPIRGNILRTSCRLVKKSLYEVLYNPGLKTKNRSWLILPGYRQSRADQGVEGLLVEKRLNGQMDIW